MDDLGYLNWLETIAGTIRHLCLSGEKEALLFLKRVVARQVTKNSLNESNDQLSIPDDEETQFHPSVDQFLQMAQLYDRRLREREAQSTLDLACMGQELKREWRFHNGKRKPRSLFGIF